MRRPGRSEARTTAGGGRRAEGRRFLFLQGPHGPFFGALARALKAEGAEVLRAGLCRADDREWAGAGPYRPFPGPAEAWPDWLAALARERGATDIVLYGDARPAHRAAAALAGAEGLRLHVFEEGYLRPHWITLERGGANGFSPLMGIPAAAAAAAGDRLSPEEGPAPAVWGAARAHARHGLRHHFDILFRNGAYPGFRPHRPSGPWAEFGFHLRRLLLRPLLAPRWRLRERRLLAGGRPFHLVLLQLAADSALLTHGPYASVADFTVAAVEAFAAGAPRGDLLVFKTHPFEDGRAPLERIARAAGRAAGVAERIVFLDGGRLGPLLDRARSAATVNSTAGQQALWRGLPLYVAGRAVHAKPEFAASGDLAAFFAAPRPPDAALYRGFRRFLLASSQLRGSFYTGAGVRSAVDAAVPKILDPLGPYDRAFAAAEAGRVIAFPAARAAAG